MTRAGNYVSGASFNLETIDIKKWHIKLYL